MCGLAVVYPFGAVVVAFVRRVSFPHTIGDAGENHRIARIIMGPRDWSSEGKRQPQPPVTNRPGCAIPVVPQGPGVPFASSGFLAKSFRCFDDSVCLRLDVGNIPYTPQQNGKAERYNPTLETLVTALLHDAGLLVA
jgi:hypothetical protein